MRLLAIISSPFPRPKRTGKNILWLALIALGATFFVIFFKPFAIENRTDIWYFNLAIAGLGFVFFLSIYVMEFVVPIITPRLFKRWNFGKAVLWYTWLILFVGAIMFFAKSYLAGFRDFTWTEYFFVLGRILGIGITVSFFVLGFLSYFNRKSVSLLSSNQDYLITSPSAKPLRLNLQELMYMVSDDNYVDIHLLKNGTRKKIIFRSSLKNIEDQIVTPLSPIYRCHRRHLINITYFEIKRKSSRNTTVQLINFEDEIPVSKQYSEGIAKLLHVRP